MRHTALTIKTTDQLSRKYKASTATPIIKCDKKSKSESQCEAHNYIIHKNAAGDNNVSWFGCGICEGWFHLICVVLANATKEQLK